MFKLDYLAPPEGDLSTPHKICVWTSPVETGAAKVLADGLGSLGPISKGLDCAGAGEPVIQWLFTATSPLFLALEMLGRPTEVSDSYRQAKRVFLMGDMTTKFRLPNNLGDSLDTPLLQHQMDYLYYCLPSLKNGGGCLNASEQGTGKTLMAVARFALGFGLGNPELPKGSALIVGPKNLSDQWEEATKQFKGPSVWLNAADSSRGNVKQRVEEVLQLLAARTRDYLVIAYLNYELLPELVRQLKERKEAVPFNLRHLTFDESWHLRNPSSQVSKAALKLAELARLSEPTCFVQCLAGTPTSRHPGELWVQLKLVNKVNDFYWTYSAFCEQFCEFETIRLPGREVRKPYRAKDLPHLASVLRNCWFRATKESCLDLPPKRFEVVKLSSSETQSKWLKALKDKGQAVLAKTETEAEATLPNHAVTLLRQHQVAGGCLPTLGGDWQDSVWLENPKHEWLVSFLREREEEDPSFRCLVWCNYSAEVKWVMTSLVQQGFSAYGVTGSSGPYPNSLEKLAEAKERFNARAPDGPQVIVAQVAALGAGHNLQAADHHVFWSNSWFVIHRTQAEDRSHRLGREPGAGVTYWDLCLVGTVDEEVLKAIKEGRDFQQRLGVDTTGS